MAAPLGETQLPFAGVFCSSGTDVTSSPGYVVKRGEKSKMLNSVSSRGVDRTRGCLAHCGEPTITPPHKVSTRRGKGGWERALPLDEYLDCFGVSSHTDSPAQLIMFGFPKMSGSGIYSRCHLLSPQSPHPELCVEHGSKESRFWLQVRSWYSGALMSFSVSPI